MKRKTFKCKLKEELFDLIELKNIGSMGLKIGEKESNQIQKRILVISKQLGRTINF